jgi:5-methyltetrahydropteroyltriglutamate--homocysteine methyltransferase
MAHPTLLELGLKPLSPTAIGSAALPAWLSYIRAEILRQPDAFSPEDLYEFEYDAVRIALDDQLDAGIELVTDGEFGRVKGIHSFIEHLGGVCPLPEKRKLSAYNSNLPLKYTCVEPIVSWNGLGTAAEFRRLKKLTAMPIKVRLPGPFTLSAPIDGGEVYQNRQSIIEGIIPILNAEIKSLAAEGCHFISLDEQGLASQPDAPAEFVEFINRTVEGVTSANVSLHICFGNEHGRASARRNYSPLFPALLAADVDQFSLEFASREMSEIELLKSITDAGKSVAVGLVDVKNLWVEPVDFIAERIRICLQHAPADLLQVTSDCDFRYTPRTIATSKMQNMAKAAVQVRRGLKHKE